MSFSHFTDQSMFAVSKYSLWYNVSNDKIWHPDMNFTPQHFLKSVYFYHVTFRTPTITSQTKRILHRICSASSVIPTSACRTFVRLWLLCTWGNKGKIFALFRLPIYCRYARTNDLLQAFLLKTFTIQKLLNDVLFFAYRRKHRAGELICCCSTDTRCRQNNSARGWYLLT
jgi:hypothetical protein